MINVSVSATDKLLISATGNKITGFKKPNVSGVLMVLLYNKFTFLRIPNSVDFILVNNLRSMEGFIHAVLPLILNCCQLTINCVVLNATTTRYAVINQGETVSI